MKLSLRSSLFFTLLASLAFLTSAFPADSTPTHTSSLGPPMPQITTGNQHCGTVMWNNAPAYYACATYITSWRDSNGWRYRFQFYSKSLNSGFATLESQSGIEFYYASNNEGGLSANWQCWDDDGNWTFDISEVLGPVGQTQITRAVNTVLFKGPVGDDGSDILGSCFKDLSC